MPKTEKCPVCGVGVKAENLVSHLKKVHPQSKKEIQSIEDKARRKGTGKSKGRRKHPASMWMFLGALALIAVVLLAIAFLPQDEGPPTGSPAPSFRLLDVESQWIDFPDRYANEVVVLDFFQAHCPGCQNNTRKTLTQVYNNYSEVVILSIDINPSEDEAKIEWFKSEFVRPYTWNGDTWRFALDKNRASSSYWGQYTPTTYIVRKGEVFFKHLPGPNVPPLSYEELSNQLDIALQP
jgi:thiol-disulfide isomerase/thioredoxin